MKTLTIILTLMMLTKSSRQYFSYSDCAKQCHAEKQSCIILQITEKSFSADCMESREICEQQSSNSIPCISEDEPTLGGNSIWTAYKKNKVPPEPKPSKDSNCILWKTSSSVLTATLVSIIIVAMYRKICEYQKERTHEPLIEENNDNPYQPTTENLG